MLALDELAGAGGAAEEPDHGGAVAVLVEEDRGAADVVLRLVELLLGRVGLGLQQHGREPEAVDLGLGGGEPVVGGGHPAGDVGQRRVEPLALGLRLDQLGAGGVLGGARLADLLLELLLLVRLLGQGATSQRDRDQGHEERRDEGRPPAHGPSVNNTSHMSNR